MSVTYQDIEKAAERLAGAAVVTPIIESPALNARLGARVVIKPETLQLGGAFKLRGAYNRISQLTEDEKTRGVVAFSSGNHAQGVALAARMVGTSALIVMPSDAPKLKIEATIGYGAEVLLYDRYTEDREAVARKIAAERGSVVVPSYDDVRVIAGQGTVGLELARQAGKLDVVLAPVGGGGLIAGTSIAFGHQFPDAEFWGVEPAAFDDTKRSFASGRRESVDPAARSLCDALQAPSPGKITFEINKRNLAGVLTVSDAEVAEAMRYAFGTLKLVVEPGGCVALAALLAGKLDLAGRSAGIVLSGGNVDPDLYAHVLAGEI
ncbi:MAG TPA: threonine/serine dehydratase [Caulobacteraceae bacterium]